MKLYVYEWGRYESYLGRKVCTDSGKDYIEAKNYTEAACKLNELYKDDIKRKDILIEMIAEVKFMRKEDN